MSSVRKTRRHALIGTLSAILFPIMAIIALHRLGSVEWMQIDFTDLDGWARRSRIEDAFAALLRYVGLLGSYWLALSSLAYLLARLSGATRLIDTTAIFTLPAVRRVTDRLVVGTLAISTLAGPAIAMTAQLAERPTASDDPIASRLSAADTDSDTSEHIIDLASLDEPEPELGELVPLRPPLVPEVGERAPTASISIRADAHLEVIVTEGDHLWAMAERRVSEALGRPASEHEIAPYWREVIDSNPELRSGNPDIIYPGEVIVLPPMD